MNVVRQSTAVGPFRLEGASFALVKIASITVPVNNPVSFVDFALPKDYVKFQLEFSEVIGSEQDSLTYWFSQDGGDTFHQGASDYNNVVLSFAFGIPSGALSSGVGSSYSSFVTYADLQGSLTFDNYLAGNDGVSANGFARIFPGSSTSCPTVISESINANANVFGSVGAGAGFPCVGMFGSALVAAKARQNFIRVQNYPGFGDTISGTFILLGLAP